ncbi:MAG: reverse transcriptase-like protein [Candidatus Buchananbacteria bacterium]|nr:reverse transcriptase-like protein [Candidatus Buchananbacteria bacterium]
MVKTLKIFTDGGARGNPGPAAIGVVIKNNKGEVLKEYAEYLGKTTNNQAEYRALLKGLELAKEFKPWEVICYLDSELVVKQMNQEFKVKDKDLQPLFVQVWNMAINFKKVSYHHIPRDFNKEADKLLNQELDKRI